jgi:hypothetical protein
VKSALGVAVLFDTRVQGPGIEGQLIAQTSAKFDGGTPAIGLDEKEWIAALLKMRHPPEREQFQKIIDDDNWNLTKPIEIYGQPFVVSWLPKST